MVQALAKVCHRFRRTIESPEREGARERMKGRTYSAFFGLNEKDVWSALAAPSVDGEQRKAVLC